MRFPVLAGLALTLVTVAPSAAQSLNRDVFRQRFTFLDNTLTVEVEANAPGTLQIVRGELGLIDVSARVPGGFSTAALGGREENSLRLAALGGEKADFIVVVPEDAYVRVKLPNKKGSEIGSTRPGGTFNWPSPESTTNAGGVTGVSASLSKPPTGPLIAYTAPFVPEVVILHGLISVETLRVRIAKYPFEVSGDRPMRLDRSAPDYVELSARSDQQDIMITIPNGTVQFRLQVEGSPLLIINGTDVAVLCEPVTQQRLKNGEQWFTFSPESGVLTCR